MSEIVHAYALVASKENPNRFYAVHLKGVVAAEVDILEPSGRHEPATHGVSRILNALNLRQWRRDWGSP